MRATIQIYNDNDDLVAKYDAPPYEKWIDYEEGYEVRRYEFRFIYGEYKPICKTQKVGDK